MKPQPVAATIAYSIAFAALVVLAVTAGSTVATVVGVVGAIATAYLVWVSIRSRMTVRRV